MAEFTLYRDSMAARHAWREMSEFARGYIEAAAFADVSEEDVAALGGIIDLDDFHPDTLATLINDANAFVQQNMSTIDALLGHDGETRDAQAVGRDIWYTQQGHGAGFWDGDWKNADAAEKLSQAAKGRERCLYLGDDGKIYVV